MTLLEVIQSQIGVVGVLSIITGLYLAKWAFDLATDPLKDIPGPFLTRFTRLWLLRHYVKGDFQTTNIKLHEKYGPIVRIGPGKYSVDSPEAAKTIYCHGSEFTKSSWYSVWASADPKDRNLFSDPNPHSHAVLRRKVASTYSMANLMSYEPYVDQCTTTFMQRLTELSVSGVVINIGHWFQCYAFETIAMISFARPIGFLDRGEDVSGIIEQLEFGTLYSSVMGLFHTWHQLVLGTLASLSTEVKGAAFIDAFTLQLIDQQEDKSPLDTDGPESLLSKFLAVQKRDPEKMSTRDIKVSIFSNLAAGSDTTSITLSGILYHLLKNPATLAKLREEIDTAASEGRISDPITWKEAQTLPYLQAVVKEGLRCHPATGFTMPRDVPKGGREIMGRWWPEGTSVGINPWVAHANTDVFGPDAKAFRPERWFGDDASGANSRREAYFLSFGMGSRTCIGKNISLLEISKCMPQILRNFDIELVDQGEWTVFTTWFTKPKGFEVRMKRRNMV